jgi:hypothetical protein
MADTKQQSYSGLVEYNGLIKDDFLREFHGQEAYKRFNEMRLNNPIIGAGLLAIEQVVRNMSWEFSSEEDNDPLVDELNEARENMSQSWNDFISEVLSFVWAGYSLFEIVYDRVGGRYLWHKFSPIGQNTVYQWKLDDNGGLVGVTQMGAPLYRAQFLPMERLLLFRTRNERNNPEGRSLLRVAWTSYYYLKNLQQFEAIGFERDTNGMPVIKLPEGADTNEDDDNSDASKAAKVVRNMRNDEQAGLILPFGWDALLLSGAGKSFADLGAAIERYEKRIATAFFVQFLLMGQNNVGSFALAENATDFFMTSVNALADIIAETFTKYAIPRLLKINGAREEDVKRVWLEHTPANNADIAKIGAFLSSVKDFLTFDEGDELWLRQMAGLPERMPEQLKEERAETQQQKQAAAEAMRQRFNNPDEQYSAVPMDDARRRDFERRWKEALVPFLEKQKRRVVNEVKNARL